MNETPQKNLRDATPPKNHLTGELIGFLKDNKKYFLIPMLLVFLILGILIIFSGSAVAPFIYTLF